MPLAALVSARLFQVVTPLLPTETAKTHARSVMKPIQFVLVFLLSIVTIFGQANRVQAEEELTGLWHAHKNFGPTVRGNLIMGENSRITGNVKVHGETRIGSGSGIYGNLTCNADINFAKRTWVNGAVIALGVLTTDTQTRFGHPNKPVTVVGQKVFLSTGTTVHGTLSAINYGVVRDLVHTTSRQAA